MKLCNACNIPMVNVMSFLMDKQEKFCRCPRCRGETKHQKLMDKELDFGEVLSELPRS